MRFKSFSLDIIDLVGIMIPGVIWSSFLFFLHVLYRDVFSLEYSLLSQRVSELFGRDTYVLNVFFFLFGSYVLGYISRLIPTQWLDWLTIPLASFGTGHTFSSVWKRQRKDKLSPYDFLFEGQRAAVQKKVKDLPLYEGSSQYVKTLFLCRRLLLHHSPALWENARRREAEIRFINTMFYIAATFSTVLLFRGNIRIGLFLLIVALFLAFTFRRRRYAESSYIYGSSFIMLLELKAKGS